MIVSHKNTGTIGDFVSTWPALHGLYKECGELDVTLPTIYKSFKGLKDFMMIQPMFNKVDFEDKIGDIDVQSHPIPVNGKPLPVQPHYAQFIIEKQLGCKIELNYNLKLELPFVEIPEEIKNKNIVVERIKNQILKQHNLFNDENKFYWIKPRYPLRDDDDDLIYNLNVCLQTKKTLYVTATGLPNLLQHFDIEMIYLQLDNDGFLAKDFAYFPHHQKKIKFMSHEEFLNSKYNYETYV